MDPACLEAQPSAFGWKTKFTLDNGLMYTQNLSQKGIYKKRDGCLGHPLLEYGFSSIPPPETTWDDSQWRWPWNLKCERQCLSKFAKERMECCLT